MDQLKLRTLVFEKTGVKIDVDDPVFALVALNEAVLAEAVERHVALLDDATAVLAEHAQALQAAGSVCGYNPTARPSATAAAGLQAATTTTTSDKRSIAIAAGAAVLGAVLVLLGQAMFFRIPPAPASTVIAKELTPDQAQAIRAGEKMAKIVQKLDPKTRNAIQAEMQKP